MSTLVTLNVFSGRPNPRWFLDDAAAAELRERIYRKPTMISVAPPTPGTLGYRGLEIRSEEREEPIYIHAGVVRTLAGSPNLLDPEREIERFIVNTMPRDGQFPGIAMPQRSHGLLLEHLERELATQIDLTKLIRVPLTPISQDCPANVGTCAPPYEPDMWNFSPTQLKNNCYNYANDRITNTIAQPGKYHSAQYTSMSCASVKPAAVADGLVAASNFTKSIPDGWYVALVIWPNMDFHWYRQDKAGCWSHKPGSDIARNTDNSNNPILDPKTANRGHYEQFCSYMVTRPCQVRIK